jgi:hypothetical protein
MSDYTNPYQSPEADIKPVGASQGGLTETMIAHLRGASPWLRFIGILSFIGCGLMAAAGVLFTVAPSLAVMNIAGWVNEIKGWAGVFMGVLYIGLSVLMFFPARFMYGFGIKIRNYLRSGADQDLEEAFKNNKSLWKFNGILAIIYLAVIPVVMVIAAIAVVMSFTA